MLSAKNGVNRQRRVERTARPYPDTCSLTRVLTKCLVLIVCAVCNIIHADGLELQTRAYKSLNLDHGEKCILFPFPGNVEYMYQQGTDLRVDLPHRRTLRNPHAHLCAGTGTNLVL